MEAITSILQNKKPVDNKNKESILSNYEAKQLRSYKQLNEAETLAKIRDVMGDSRYANKYRKMVKDGYSIQLQELAEIARKKSNPVTYFIKCASKACWDKTLAILDKCRKVVQSSYVIAEKLKEAHTIDHVRAAWKLLKKNISCERALAKAFEVGNSPNRLFWYLVSDRGGVV